VWIGVSVENQKYANERRELLRTIPASVRFVSFEPALAVVDWTGWQFINWLIAGGESSPGKTVRTNAARAAHPDAFRSARDFCGQSGIAFYFKQWGNWMPHPKPPIRGKNNGAGIYVFPTGSYGCQGDYWDGRAAGMDLVGKKEAGRMLDGREWNEFPRVETLAGTPEVAER
jgi:protein gp37